MHDRKRTAEPAESPTPAAEPGSGGSGATEMDRATLTGEIVADVTNLAWRSRMGWLDDGGR